MAAEDPSFGEVDTATIAFRRLLKNAAVEDQARVDALVVLSQSTVYAALWPGSDTEIRTLTNSSGEIAMPLFTGFDIMNEVARLYGWLNPDGSLQSKEMGARQALRQAIARGVQYIVVDFGSHFAVEFAKQEIEPLLMIDQERSSTGPFAGTGRVSSSLMAAVKQTPRSTNPPRKNIESLSSTSRHASAQEPAEIPDSAITTQEEIGTETGTPTGQLPQAATQLLLYPLSQSLNDELLMALSERLHQFPEVEWACTASVQQNGAAPIVGVRVDPQFLNRWEEIENSLIQIGQEYQMELRIIVLDNAHLVRQARSSGIVFFPWRK